MPFYYLKKNCTEARIIGFLVIYSNLNYIQARQELFRKEMTVLIEKNSVTACSNRMLEQKQANSNCVEGLAQIDFSVLGKWVARQWFPICWTPCREVPWLLWRVKSAFLLQEKWRLAHVGFLTSNVLGFEVVIATCRTTLSLVNNWSQVNGMMGLIGKVFSWPTD